LKFDNSFVRLSKNSSVIFLYCVGETLGAWAPDLQILKYFQHTAGMYCGIIRIPANTVPNINIYNLVTELSFAA
jgi:hypothetical protein